MRTTKLLGLRKSLGSLILLVSIVSTLLPLSTNASNPNLNYFGWWGFADGNNQPNPGWNEVKDHANIAFALPTDIPRISSYGMKSIVIFWEMFTPVPWYDPAIFTPGTPSYVIWQKYITDVQAHINDVAAIYVVDEPDVDAASMANLERVAQELKSVFPNTPLWVNFQLDLPSAQNISIPPTLDWVSFDCYHGPFETACGGGQPSTTWSIPTIFQALKSRLYPHQKVMMIPQAFIGTTAYNWGNESDLVTLADNYYTLAQSDTSIIGIVPFYWWTGSVVGGGNIGAQDMPTLMQKYTQIGRAITGKPTVSASPSSICISGGVIPPVTLSWSFSKAISVYITPDVGFVGPSGSVTVHPASNTTYNLNDNNGITGSVTVSVSICPITPTPVPTPTPTPTPTSIPSPGPIGQSPTGYLDTIRDGVVDGWGYDPDSPNSSISIHIYIDQPAGTQTDQSKIFSLITDVLRTDVNTVKQITGTHGFRFIIPDKFKDGLNHTLYAYAIDLTNPSNNKLLINSPKQFILSTSTATPISTPISTFTPSPSPTPSTSPTTRIKLMRSLLSPRVYYITEKGLKRWIPTESIFLSYGNRWQDVVTVPQSQLDAIPNNILIKLPPSDKVYKLENGIKRWISSVEAFNINRFSWDQIAPVNQTEFDYYPLGTNIN